MIQNKTIALIAHDRRKSDMIDWVEYNAETLLYNKLIGTGTTGKLINDMIMDPSDLNDEPIVTCVASGPLGGDAEIAAMVVRGEIDLCVFFIDDLRPNPHEADIQMLLRQCRVHNVPVACNRASADFMITSDLWGTDYIAVPPSYKSFERE